MRWFKHFHDSHESNRIAVMVEKKGLECEARWFRLLSLLTKELDTSNFNASFTLHWEVIGSKLKVKRKQTLVKLLSFWVEIGLLEYSVNGSFIEITCDTLWELQDKHSKYNRKRVAGDDSQATNKKENKSKKENNTLSLDESEKTIFDDVRQEWNDICSGNGKLKQSLGLKSETTKNFFNLLKLNPNLRKIESWRECFEVIAKNDFLNGSGDASGFVCTLNWLIDKEKVVDVLEGQFCGNSGNKLDFSKVDYN